MGSTRFVSLSNRSRKGRIWVRTWDRWSTCGTEIHQRTTQGQCAPGVAGVAAISHGVAPLLGHAGKRSLPVRIRLGRAVGTFRRRGIRTHPSTGSTRDTFSRRVVVRRKKNHAHCVLTPYARLHLRRCTQSARAATAARVHVCASTCASDTLSHHVGRTWSTMDRRVSLRV